MDDLTIKRSHEFGTLTEQDLTTFEAAHGLTLPLDYREFLLTHNGGKPEPDWLHFYNRFRWVRKLRFFYGVHAGPSWASLEWHMKNIEYLPAGHIPIVGDSAAGEYLLCISGGQAGSVYRLDHVSANAQWTETKELVPMDLVANSFTGFLALIRCK